MAVADSSNIKLENILTEATIMNILKGEYHDLVKSSMAPLFEEEGEKDDEEKKPKKPEIYNNKIGDVVLGKGTVIRHKDTGLLYKLISVSPSGVIVQSPDGKTTEKVDKQTLEKEYLIK